jgi:hypothetical protein
VTKNIELKNDVSVVRSNDRRVFSLVGVIDLHRGRQDAALYLALPELDYSELCFGLCLNLSSNPAAGCLRLGR